MGLALDRIEAGELAQLSYLFGDNATVFQRPKGVGYERLN